MTRFGETRSDPARRAATLRVVAPRAGLDLQAEMLRLCARIGFSPPRS
jgi:hypothetical protein